ncbi:1-aminocyclopropane-1-carboxylate synthase-like protein 2 [Gossypium arboreum]|uniref:1-aminocyclopropane-1-carboxylate synthase-like protein 2 n=1 Tax=Gossypium arboreum TaxID=29729 RepID=A0A0B0PHW9_GOSAR|nr:1-aminocyclopropane-1-carboxylate synthase-like protein 2 [Gossypium arboreum]
MKICFNELNLNMSRSRTKEIGFGSGKNESCRLAAWFRFILSEVSL